MSLYVRRCEFVRAHMYPNVFGQTKQTRLYTGSASCLSKAGIGVVENSSERVCIIPCFTVCAPSNEYYFVCVAGRAHKPQVWYVRDDMREPLVEIFGKMCGPSPYPLSTLLRHVHCALHHHVCS